MISRNLGPELGGAVGILFYLGTTIAASMYLTGAVEIFLLYIMPEGKVFESIYNNFRLFGSGLLFLVGLIVLAGVKVTAPLCLHYTCLAAPFSRLSSVYSTLYTIC
ncbi:hypothetical protein ANCCEY_06992 [Ancylostoma ceylanicum]|uniref:Amino acid permease/ SLC12A domain-containing protein n=1 Tax=Ancylostoma ceylanicum TaxID=53326 RepID=A0A0D6LPE6_9BILA|nr:hypothetical protein ANCCEY_06992 [Ancylostoma ceylanicum]